MEIVYSKQNFFSIKEESCPQKPHILIIEDDRDYYEIFDEYLKREGYIVSIVTNINDARFIINNKHVDLICLDILLDGVFLGNGKLKDSWLLHWTYLLDCAKDKKTPVVVITSAGNHIDHDLLMKKSREYNVKYFFFKEKFDINTFIKSINDNITNEREQILLYFQKKSNKIDQVNEYNNRYGRMIKKTKILLLAANPFDTKRLRLEEEIRKIKTNIKISNKRGRLIFKSASAVTAEILMQEMLDERPDYVQFSGHGYDDGIYLEQDNGKSHFVNTEALEALFSHFNKVLCVFLNCCYSEIQAQKIAAHIPYVIGTKSSVLDEAAIIFSTGFYQAVGAGEDIPSAFDAGKVYLKLKGHQEDMPVLWINGTVAL